MASVFTPRHVEALRPAIAARIDELLDGFAGCEVVDVITDLALPLPGGVIGDLLGIPDVDRSTAAPWVRDLVAHEPSADLAAVQAAVGAEDRLAEYFTQLLAEKRRTPADDLLRRLATARGDDQLDDDECVGTAILVFAAGFETTTNLVGNGLAALLGAPGQLDLLRNRPELAAPAVEELLRFDAPVRQVPQSVGVRGDGNAPDYGPAPEPSVPGGFRPSGASLPPSSDRGTPGLAGSPGLQGPPMTDSGPLEEYR
jgi:cytochrome P450